MKDWKTTVAGLIAGALIALQTILANLQSGTPINWWQIAAAFAVAAIGYHAQDKKVEKVVTTVGTGLILLLVSPLLQSCASTNMNLVSGTMSNGDTFPLCLEVTQSTPFKVTLLAAFCAAVQTEIDAKAAEYKKMYPTATITEIMGKETKKLN